MKTAVLLYHHFSEYEVSVALSVLKQADRAVVTIGTTADQIVGESGLTCVPSSSLESIDMSDLDSLVLPGCDDIGHIKDETSLFDFIAAEADTGAIVAAISSAPFLLAKSGVLKGHRYTVGFNREQRDFIGVFDEDNYVDAPLVSDGNVLTSKSAYFIDFGIKLGNMLKLSFDSSWYR